MVRGTYVPPSTTPLGVAYTFRFRGSTGVEHDETHEFPIGTTEHQVKEWLDHTLDEFNIHARARGIPERELVSMTHLVATIKVNIAGPSHDWRKVNFVSGDRGYDMFRCARCGITAKRYGIGSIRRHSKYRAKRFDSCPPKEGRCKKPS